MKILTAFEMVAKVTSVAASFTENRTTFISYFSCLNFALLIFPENQKRDYGTNGRKSGRVEERMFNVPHSATLSSVCSVISLLVLGIGRKA